MWLPAPGHVGPRAHAEWTRDAHLCPHVCTHRGRPQVSPSATPTDSTLRGGLQVSVQPRLLNLPRVLVINNPTWELKVSQALESDHGRQSPSLGRGPPTVFQEK